MKRIGLFTVTALALSASSVNAGLFDSLFSNASNETVSAEVAGGESVMDKHMGGHCEPCKPCFGWHRRPCFGHNQKCGAKASKCTQKSASKCAQKSASKCTQKSASKCTQKSASKCAQKSAPKCEQKSAKCSQKSAPKCAQKHGDAKGGKCASRRCFSLNDLHIKLPTCHASKCKTPATHTKSASKCHRSSLNLFAKGHGKCKGKSDGKGFTTTPADDNQPTEVDLGEPPAPEVEQDDAPVDNRSASLRLFPGNAQLLPIRLGG